jgi:hypothetical protein
MQKFSERRLKENEVIFQQANQGVADFVTEDTHDPDVVIKFYCECSNIDCRERISLTAKDYHKLHKTERQFIALNGHEIPAIEKIVANHGSFNQIEKEGEIPSVVDIQPRVEIFCQLIQP